MDRYQLIQELARSGFGVVYRGARVGEEGFRRPVAIKLLREDMSSQTEVVARLKDEARLLARLHHPGIVAVEDLAFLQGRWAVVMELIPGADLQELFLLGRPPIRALCEILAEVASALDFAHHARDPETGQPLDLVHRDIKPANVRVTPTGQVKLLDFGIASARSEFRSAQTRDLLMGTEGYAAPERYENLSSPAVDLYALGVVLYEGLAGERLPRPSLDPERHRGIVEAAAKRLPPLPPDLARLLASSLAYEPQERPSAREFSRRARAAAASLGGPGLADWLPPALAQVAAQRPTTVLSQPLPTPLPPPGPRRLPWPVAALALTVGFLGALTLAGGVGLALLVSQRGERAEEPPEIAPEPAAPRPEAGASPPPASGAPPEEPAAGAADVSREPRLSAPTASEGRSAPPGPAPRPAPPSQPPSEAELAREMGLEPDPPPPEPAPPAGAPARLKHTPVKQASPASALNLRARIEDPQYDIVVVHYRLAGESGWRERPMTYNAGTGEFVAKVPQDDGVEYYITANAGISDLDPLSSGSEGSPHAVAVEGPPP